MLSKPPSQTHRVARIGLTWAWLLLCSVLSVGCASNAERSTRLSSEERRALSAAVLARENAFANTLAERNFEAFADFIHEDAVFLYGGNPQRGKDAILKAWQSYFAAPTPPFSWRGDYAEVDPQGLLGQTKGTVYGPDGKAFAVFWSVWKRGPDGEWLVYFDDGCWPGCFPGTGRTEKP